MTTTITLTKGYTAIVDDVDADLAALNWHVTGVVEKNSYAARTVNSKPVWMHRVILERMLNRSLVKGEMCDHINGNIRDNRRSNLRLATHTENLRNSKGQSRRKSPYKGVTWQGTRNCWKAQIGLNGKVICLGYFKDPIEAHAAYCEAGRKYFGEFFNPG